MNCCARTATTARIFGWIFASLGCVLIGIIGCGEEVDEPVQKIVVLARLMNYQEPFVSEKLQAFAKQHGVEVSLEQYNHLSDLEEIVESKRYEGNGSTLALIKTHQSVFEPIAAAGLVRSLEDILGEDEAATVLSEFVPESMELITYGKKHFGIPRKLESWSTIYRVSRVGDVYLGWERFKDEIDAILKLENGRGLPEGYNLDLTLDDWDEYDAFVAAYIWRQSSYGQKKMGRLTHRRLLEFGTFMDYAARIYALGGVAETLTKGIGPALEDLLMWEAVFIKHDLYLTGVDSDWVWKEFYGAIYRGDLFMFRFHSVDTFALRNRQFEFGGEPVFDLDDLTVALSPAGASLELDESGRPARTGTLRGVRTGWAWMVPSSCKAPRLGLELARYLSGPEVHGEECGRFGMLPVRHDVWSRLDEVFPEEWQRQTIRKSMEQFRESRLVPSREATAGFLKRLNEAIHELPSLPSVKDKTRPVDRAAIRKLADLIATP